MATILENEIVTNYILPFLLLFFISFGILQKSKLFGDHKQLNAGIAFAIGLIFVGAVFPKLVVGNLILFLTVAIVTLFVGLMLWGFVSGEDGLKFSSAKPGLKYFIGIVITIAVLVALLWSTGVQGSFFFFLFRQSWSRTFWTNFSFLAVVIIALGFVLGKTATKSG